MTSSGSGGAPTAFDLRLVPERLRIWGYASFWAVVVAGIVLTRYFSDVNVEDAVMTQVFGYPNICVYFDHPPSNRVLPLLWAVTLVILLTYISSQWLLMRAQVRQGFLERGRYRSLSAMKLFEAATLVAFSMIFAVSPEGRDVTLWVHTVPFFIVQLGLVSLAFSNTLHGIWSGYWWRLALPRWFTGGALVYSGLLALVVAFKIPYATNAMAGTPWWEQTEGLVSVAMVIDWLFLVLIAIVPMAKAAFLLEFRSDQLEAVRLTPALGTGS